MDAKIITFIIIGIIITAITIVSACTTFMLKYKDKNRELEIKTEKDEQAQKNQEKIIETIGLLID